jgi:hypothetical protein
MFISVTVKTSQDAGRSVIPVLKDYFKERAVDKLTASNNLQKLPSAIRTLVSNNQESCMFRCLKGSLVYVLPATMKSFDVVIQSKKGLHELAFDYFSFVNEMEKALRDVGDWGLGASVYEPDAPSLLIHAQNQFSVGLVVSIAWATIQSYWSSISIAFGVGIFVSAIIRLLLGSLNSGGEPNEGPSRLRGRYTFNLRRNARGNY